MKYRVLAYIHLADNVEQVRHERTQKEQRLKRLGRSNAGGAYTDEEYVNKRDEIDSDIRNAVSTEMPSIEEAAAIFEDIPSLWDEVAPEDRREFFFPMAQPVTGGSRQTQSRVNAAFLFPNNLVADVE